MKFIKLMTVIMAGVILLAISGCGQDPSALTPAPIDWIDPNTTPPANTLYKLYDTSARGVNTQGSYLIYLPPSYNTDTTKKYPVIYWLHGGFGYQRDVAELVIPPFVAAMQAGKMAETIIVMPQALPSGWYANSKDGARPIENVIIQNLVPHIDATYRTIANAKARGIEGISMGGYGTLRLGLKYPEVFGVISAFAPSIRENLSEEPAARTSDTFFGDQAYYEETGPWGIVKHNTEAIHSVKPTIRLVVGDKDGLDPIIQKFSQLLTSSNITHEFIEVSNAGHEYQNIMAQFPTDPYSFWKTAFEPLSAK